MATAPTTPGSSASTLSTWAGPYVTDMLGQAQAIAATPYQTYQGPMTAGESGLQSKVFQGLGNLTFPQNIGGTFAQQGGSFFPNDGAGGAQQYNFLGKDQVAKVTAEANRQAAAQGISPEMALYQYAKTNNISNTGVDTLMGFDPGSTDKWAAGNIRATGLTQGPGTGQPSSAGGQPSSAGGQPSSVAQSYMNPYLQSVLQPQMEELRRQSQITQMGNAAKMTGAGAFGGARQGIMDAETQRNLMQEMNKTVGQGYATAFDKGTNQFNIEQGQGMGLANLLAQQGAAQRGIEQEGVTADYNEFLTQRDYPMKQTQYLQSMLQGLPISTVTSSAAPQSTLGNLTSTVGGLGSLFENIKKLIPETK